MKGLLGRRCLLVGVFGITGLGVTGGGCSDTSSVTDLGPDPVILQVVVARRSGVSGNGVAALAYGVHPEINVCDDVTMCPSGLSCATTGALAGHCVDSSGNQPRVTRAAAFLNNRIRAVVEKLLNGQTIEHFWCACFGGNNVLGGADTSCDGTVDAMRAYSTDPKNCSACPGGFQFVRDMMGNVTMVVADPGAQGRCLDNNFDGVPDRASMFPGLGTITCNPGGFVHQNAPDEGYYDPSGAQQVPAIFGPFGLGPAVEFVLATPMPTNADCTLTLSSSITDKAGTALQPTPTPISWHTEKLVLLADPQLFPVPDSMNAVGDVTEVDLAFPTRLRALSASDGNVVVTMGATVIPGTLDIQDATANFAKCDTDTSLSRCNILVWTPDAPLAPGVYTVKVLATNPGNAANSIADTFNIPMPGDQMFTFTVVPPM
jgi:hypothetical protein